MYMSYSLTRSFEYDLSNSSGLTVDGDDAINCAHMLAAGFNTMSRNMLGDFVLGVVDTKAGTVQYDGKIESIERPEPAKPGVYEQTFKFEPSVDADTILTLFGNGDAPTFMAFGKVNVEPAGPYEAPSPYAHIARSVLESAYGELEDVKASLEVVGVETIPASKGVRTLIRRLDHEEHARTAMEAQHEQENESARAELIAHVKGAYDKWSRVDPSRTRSDLKSHLRGMIEVLSKFLVAIGEADADERHAVALRVCEIPEGNYLYDDQ